MILTLEQHAEKLEKTGETAIMWGDFLYVIYESAMEEGYMVDKYDPFDLEEGVIDGGLCTGSAMDAVEFLL